ncbi:MAG: DUF3597 domain-containing protein [Proteobacteria bacterium]|nr:DUF3597 domain-containing protein [Pseudomonadota bacterium]
MSIFSAIKDAIFGHKAEATAPAADATPTDTPTDAPAAAAVAAPVDVVAVLSAMPGADNLNWQTSVVDLMKLVGIDASYDNRKSLAQELGNADYAGSAEDNITLQKQVMKALADNGGQVPAELLD